MARKPDQIVLLFSIGNFVLLLAVIIGFSRMGGKIEDLAQIVKNKFGN